MLEKGKRKMINIIPYLGGKLKMCKYLNQHIIEASSICLVDVFGGGGSVLLNSSDGIKSKVYNDIDGELVNMFGVIRDNKDSLKGMFEYILVSRKIFNKLRDAKFSEFNSVERAFRTIYLWKIACSGRRNSEKSFNFGYSMNRNAVNLKKLIEDIDLIYRKIYRWHIECLDYKDLIKKYDRKSTLFYIDSPYWMDGKNVKYYKHNMDTIKEQEEIRDLIDNISGKFLITYPNTIFYRDLYKNYNIIATDVKWATGNWGGGIKDIESGKELIIRNY